MKIEEEFSKLPALQKLFWRCAYAVLCAALATGFLIAVVYTVVFFADLFDVGRLRLRVPVFGLLLPIIAFFAGWKQAEVYQPFFAALYAHSIYFRIFILTTLFYVVCTTVFVEFFEPGVFRYGLDFNGKYDLDGRFGDFVKLITFPPLFFGFGLFLLRKLKPFEHKDVATQFIKEPETTDQIIQPSKPEGATNSPFNETWDFENNRWVREQYSAISNSASVSQTKENTEPESSAIRNLQSEITTCPFCAEDIKAAAIKCKHCGEWLEESSDE